MRAARVPFLVFALMLGGGCGDDDGATPTNGTADKPRREEPRTTKAQYVKAADRICASAQREIRPLDERFKAILAENRRGLISDAEIAERVPPIFRRFVSIYDDSQSQLEALTPPTGDRPIVRKYLGARRDTYVLFEGLADGYARQDLQKLLVLNKESSRLTTRASSLAEGYGYRRCG